MSREQNPNERDESVKQSDNESGLSRHDPWGRHGLLERLRNRSGKARDNALDV